MLYLSEKNYLTVWKVEDKGNYVSVFATSGKKQQDGTYKNSKWNCRFIGNAKNDALSLEKKDRITVTSGCVENVEGQDGKNWLTLLVFDFEYSEGAHKKASNDWESVSDNDELPF